MGMPLYGQAFTLKDASEPTLNSPASKGQAGQFTRFVTATLTEETDFFNNKKYILGLLDSWLIMRSVIRSRMRATLLSVILMATLAHMPTREGSGLDLMTRT